MTAGERWRRRWLEARERVAAEGAGKRFVLLPNSQLPHSSSTGLTACLHRGTIPRAERRAVSSETAK